MSTLPTLRPKEIYSFDLFDTLVCRSVKHPSAVFKLLELYADIDYRSSIFKVLGFRYLRIISEKAARHKSDKEDVTLDEIYQQVAKFIRNVDIVKQVEIDFEMSVLFPIEHNLELIKKLIDEGKECCIVSDMYLPLEVIKKIVQTKLGINVPIFLSCEYMKTKHTGSLYEEVKDYYNVDYSDIEHHGDNEHADIHVAKKLGIKANFIESYNEKTKSNNLFDLLKPVEPSKLDDVFYELGFYLAGPCVWSTVKWMDKDLSQKDIKKVFFGARDGYLFNEFFREISDIDSTYFRVSRRALFLPTFALNDSYNELLFEGGVSLTASDFFHRLDLTCPDSLINLNPIQNKELFIQEIKNQGFFESCQNELNNLKTYLNSIGFSGEIAFFDLGWRGSLQASLDNIVKDSNIHGYYFGLTEKKHTSSNYNGFYFYKDKNILRKLMLLQCLAFFEYLFTEPEQSLKKVDVIDGKIQFIFINKEDSVESINSRKMIMEGARDFMSVVKPIDSNVKINIDSYERMLHKQMKEYIDSPSTNVINAFSNIEHSAAFGGTVTKKIVEPKKFSLKGYRHSFWRSGYVSSFKGFYGFVGRLIHACIYNYGGFYFLKLFYKILWKLKG